jgi:hypothetical protein
MRRHQKGVGSSHAHDVVLIALTACLAACSNGAGRAGATGGAGAAVGSGGATAAGGTTSSSGAGGAVAAGGAPGGGGTSAAGGTSGCFRARRLWFEDFETGDYSRWTSKTYNSDWGNNCQSNALSTSQAVSPTHANRSEIVCEYTAEGNVHRGYGGLQFSGDELVPAYTNTGTGTDAPYGIVNTFHTWLETTSVFQNGKWFSFWTVNSDCGWADEVLTLGLEDPSNRLAAAHYQPGGGTRSFAPGAPGFPLGRWVRLTIYVNYYTGIMHVWQDGQEISHVTFFRPKKTICQWHWGAYASGDNDNLVLFEDDNSIWKLEQEWTDMRQEPNFGGEVPVCAP